MYGACRFLGCFDTSVSYEDPKFVYAKEGFHIIVHDVALRCVTVT